MDTMIPRHQEAVRRYLCARRLRPDPNTGTCCSWSFGTDPHSLAATFKRDPRFPRFSVCALIENPEVDLLGVVVEVILPEMLAGELSVVRDALELACDVEQGNWGAALVAGLALAGAIGVGVAATRSAASRPPREVSLVRSRPSRPALATSRQRSR